jgi:type I restriction-modification system DNA methylase subunit
MKKGNIRDLHHGREVWKHLERVCYSRSTGQVFSDWLDLMLAAYLSLTENFARPNFLEKLKQNKFDGAYEGRYIEIAKQYADDAKPGERAIDHLAAAHTELVKEVEVTQVDVLGEIYMAMVTFGEHGQFFTPRHISEAMAQIVGVKDGETCLDPCCGSGTMLIEAGKQNPNAIFTGCDLDPRCAKMAALNMIFFNLDAEIYWGNSLMMEMYTKWRISKGGLIWETPTIPREEKPEKREPPPATSRQQELFAA